MLSDEIVYTFTALHTSYVLYVFVTGFIFCQAFMLFGFWVKVGSGNRGACSEPDLGPVEVCTNLARRLQNFNLEISLLQSTPFSISLSFPISLESVTNQFPFHTKRLEMQV